MKSVILFFLSLGFSFVSLAQCAVAAPVPDDACYQQVIAGDSWCCDNDWDGICQAAYDACVPPVVMTCDSGSYVVESDDWENTNVDAALIPGDVYHNTPQTHGPHGGARHLYLNFVTGFTGLVYDRQFTVCADSTFEVTCWMHDTWGRKL